MSDPGPNPPARVPLLTGSVRVVRSEWTASSWLARSLIASGLVVLALLAIVLLIPAAIIGAAAIGVYAIRAGFRRMFDRARSPNGALDGRRNVKVILPDERA